MKDIAIQGISGQLTQLGQQKNTTGQSLGDDFQKMLQKSISEVNQQLQESNKAIENLSAGRSESIHETMIAMEKANVSFQMMMQVRNRIIDAYQEIMKSSM